MYISKIIVPHYLVVEKKPTTTQGFLQLKKVVRHVLDRSACTVLLNPKKACNFGVAVRIALNAKIKV